MRASKIGYGLQAFVSDFSVASAIKSVRPLKLLVLSNHPEARKLAEHLIKTTAVLLQLKPDANYQQFMAVPITSMK